MVTSYIECSKKVEVKIMALENICLNDDVMNQRRQVVYDMESSFRG